MLISIRKQAKSLLPLVAVAAFGIGNGQVARAQADAEQSETAASDDADAAMFDAKLVEAPAGAACLPGGLLHPDRVFTPPEPGSGMPGAAPQTQPFMNQPQVASLAAGQGALTAQNSVPALMGDFFGGPPATMDSAGPGFVVFPRSTGVGLMKFAENTSPLPRDRVFVNYSYFDDVNIAPGGVTVNRVTPGIEKTFLNGAASLEFRAPMAWTTNSTIPFDVNTFSVIGYDSNHFELGNMTLFAKGLLYQDETFSMSTGLGVQLPTADDIRVVDPSLGITLNTIRNRSVHLLPFIGSVYTPNDRWFFQNVWQVDIPLVGNTVYSVDFPGFAPRREGVLDDPTFLFGSFGSGYWIYQSDDPSALLSRIALISEIHFNRTLDKTDSVRGVNGEIGNRVDIQTINAVIGTNFMVDNNKSLMLGYCTPIGGGNDRAFDGEFRLMFNWYFGNSMNRATRVQF